MLRVEGSGLWRREPAERVGPVGLAPRQMPGSLDIMASVQEKWNPSASARLRPSFRFEAASNGNAVAQTTVEIRLNDLTALFVCLLFW